MEKERNKCVSEHGDAAESVPPAKKGKKSNESDGASNASCSITCCQPQSHSTPTLGPVSASLQPRFGLSNSSSEGIHMRKLHCSMTALAHYNKQHGMNYKLVFALESNNFTVLEERFPWYHCNFLAAVPEPPYDGGDSFYIKLTDDSSSVKLFFAELTGPSSTDLVVETCCILEDGDNVQQSCLRCRGVVHPYFAFKHGVGNRTAYCEF